MPAHFKVIEDNREKVACPVSDAGAERRAIAYTVLATCAAHRVEPLAYLTDVITMLQDGWLKSRLAELSPDAWLKTTAVPAASGSAG